MPTFRGKPACSCLVEWLPVYEKELQRLGILKGNLRIYQLIGGAAASGGTHSKGGAFDLLDLPGGRDLVVARQMGADATWSRPYNWDGRGGMAHIHGVLTGCPHNKPARYQITAVKAKRNGLGWMGLAKKDDGPRPLSGRTYKQGIAWAKARGADKRIGKWMEINHGAATEALDTDAAMDKWEARRKRVVIIARDKNPDVLGGLECGGGNAWHYISTKYKSFGQVLVINAGGRALWRNSATTGPTIDKDIFKPKAYKGDVKEVPWFVGPVNDAKMLTGLAHLDSDAPAAFNADRADEILDFLEAKAKAHKIGRSQIVLMIDMADKTGTVRKRIVDRGYGSVFTEAKKATNADLSSNTYFKKPVKGYSGDDIFVWVGDGKTSKGPDAPRPVPVASKTVPAKIGDLDHLPLAAVLERQ